MFRKVDRAVCNICGHKEFKTGPGNRLSPNKMLPCCSNCRSLERHRALRLYYECLPIGYLGWRRAMQFSGDASMRASWFADFEISQYEKENSLDVQKIDRPDASYDLLVLNHVLECVPDAKASFKELIRILSPEGVLQISFSKPHSRDRTVDFAEPYTSARFFHHFGRDVGEYFAIAGMGVKLYADQASDPVTRTRQDVHFFSRDAHQLELLKAYSGLRQQFETA